MKRNEHTTVILVHSNEWHPVSPNPKWNPLNKMYQTHLHSHCSWTYKKLGTLAEKHYFSTHILQETEDVEIYLRPVEQITQTVATPLTKP